MDEPLTPFWRGVHRTQAALPLHPLEEVRSRSWRSGHFRGARHQFVLRFDGPRASMLAERFEARLGLTALEMPGHIVADVSIVAREHRPGWARLRIEVLTVKA